MTTTMTTEVDATTARALEILRTGEYDEIACGVCKQRTPADEEHLAYHPEPIGFICLKCDARRQS